MESATFIVAVGLFVLSVAFDMLGMAFAAMAKIE